MREGVWMGVGCPWPHVRNDIVTPRYLLLSEIDLDQRMEDDASCLLFGSLTSDDNCSIERPDSWDDNCALEIIDTS